jgi:hypothetical protein
VGSPFFGGLKQGTGLILDMGEQVRLSSVTVTFGPTPGADVSTEVGTAYGIGGTHTFRSASPAAGRYVLIWFRKLPPLGAGKYGAEISNIVVRGSG